MINFDAFVSSLPLMVYGMLGVFFVILLIYLSVKLMGWIIPDNNNGE
ncbi:MAG: OadG family protein [Clostridiales bacterium]|jgi:Na+-transporting methylmalonyl-CoA/oxaloacetate decarboxylase gamma subunit|nr:OadG family protein [Clostridiales bacterium]